MAKNCRVKYPSYKEMINNIMTYSPTGMKMGLIWASEYNEAYHDLCKIMFENFTEDKCRRMGVLIYEDGGMDALRACFYILFHFTKGATKPLERYWNGVGEWRS